MAPPRESPLSLIFFLLVIRFLGIESTDRISGNEPPCTFSQTLRRAFSRTIGPESPAKRCSQSAPIPVVRRPSIASIQASSFVSTPLIHDRRQTPPLRNYLGELSSSGYARRALRSSPW